MNLFPQPTAAEPSPLTSVAPLQIPSSQIPPPPTTNTTWRWAIVHFPWLDGITPRGEIVVVSDKRHIAEARKAHPDLPLWHEKELALFGEQMDEAELGASEFISVNRLKLKTDGWFMGTEHKEDRVSR